MPSSLLPVSISARRVLILGLVAGYVDALSFVDLSGVFAGAMTGNTTHMGASFISGNWQHGLLLMGVLGVFFLAAILASLMRLLWSPACGVMVMTIFMVLAQAVQGSSLRYWGEFLVLPALLAVQGETIAKFSGTPMPTIVVTTNLLKAASGIAEWMASWIAPDRNIRPVAGSIFLPLLSWGAFLAGVMAAATGLALHGSFPFLWPVPFLVFLYRDIWQTERSGQDDN
ncbi:YoaK family protein (plasmid) [Acetobacter sp. AC2005]|uniref:YoaK family protein n=1 Tax=Acetobacter sp. AC2005 TaxID=3134142 RepID=UPI0030D2AA02